ncbi:type III PLP-dependent enzyme [Brevibacillus dissolubilis]|uniref:type III PLP-dependent enzyme n=1 Tax=Brevibacillus dissolubilis TaxID=1844116 RepID=UPI0011170028|nr:type III PLP-dependent enzyme [Brevibacillus dissolubilis]
MKKLVTEYIQKQKQEREQPFCAFLYDLPHLRQHVTERVQTLPSPCRLFYAIKANSEQRILETLAPIVHGFEVASLGEIRKVRAVAPDIPILFGGPGKTDEELEGAIEHNVTLIHVESLHELQRLNFIAQKRNIIVPILLRINLRGPFPDATLAMAGRPTQFGIDESRIDEAIQLALSLENVKLEGFHFHSLSNNLDARKHVELVSFYLQTIKKWITTYHLNISYLNAGGGIGVNYADLNQQFDWHQFVTGLAARLADEAIPGVEIFFECGRYLTASCGYYAVEVLDIKENHGQTYAIIRGGTHHFRLPQSWQHSHPFTVIESDHWRYPFARKEHHDTEMTVVGQLCTPKDVLAKAVPISRLRVGDIICFLYAGAYGWAISHHDFLSHPHADLVYLDQPSSASHSHNQEVSIPT